MYTLDFPVSAIIVVCTVHVYDFLQFCTYDYIALTRRHVPVGWPTCVNYKQGCDIIARSFCTDTLRTM